ncbi:SDR family NAD(P)-dependent oxidoreductase [Arthrobacter sp. GMC3]|uniref:SDR family NAD(P)-dependent oxidoreductase n=1 Tax=Arthrobacter sp. GMC3 TaxID=2058894 RepID=UPI000CE31F98|nr:SDR family NAD(P)-dependent oxidoreductase [Arthrobacter sp. GMC3]
MTTTLITGANKGLGFETARQLVAAGHTVYLGCRDAGRGRAAAESVGGHFIELDVTSDASVTAAAERIRAEAGRLDVLVNNAGISGAFASPADVTAGSLQEVYDVNVFGTVRMIHAFLPLLRESSGAIVNVSSGMGSITITSDPARGESALHSVVYSSSKSAVNMLTTQYAKAFPELRINAVDPGYTNTEFNGNRGTQTVEEGAEVIVATAMAGADGPSGTYKDRSGTLPW